LWTASALPSVVAVAPLPSDLAAPGLQIAVRPGWVLAEAGPERLIELRGSLHRIHLVNDPRNEATCALLPLDRLFEVRAAAALRLWRGLAGRTPRREPTALPAPRRDRLVLALRALDARCDSASYREIATALFGADGVPKRGWKTHDLRDRIVRLTRLGFAMMQGGYRRLLLYPFRGAA
jgi:T6SS, Transcription factor, DNA binding domain